MGKQRRALEPSHGKRRNTRRAKALLARALTAPSRAQVQEPRSTAAEAEFWQTHEVASVGAPVRADYRRAAPSDVVHLRLDRAAIRRLKAKAAKAGLPFATYASSVLTRDARTGR